MSETTRDMTNREPTGRGSVKTLAIRLEPHQHAQLSLIAQLRATTLTDEIRSAIEAHLDNARHAPELAAQANTVLADIERDALARKTAIATLFGNDSPVEPADDAPNTTASKPRTAGRPNGGRQG